MSLAEEIEALYAAADPADGLATVEEAIRLLDEGRAWVAEPDGDGWRVNEWAKKAILLYFRLRGMETLEAGPFEYLDKVPLKRDYGGRGEGGAAVARYGSYSDGVVLMPSYVNIGAWVGPRTMVDTWATVGSCAQIGADVHLSGGVGIGGVLEPLQASPVIVEDGAFLGFEVDRRRGRRGRRRCRPRCEHGHHGLDGHRRRHRRQPVEYRGRVPPRSVIPGTRPKEFPAGSYGVPAALIIGQRSASTDLKTSLNDALRTHGVAV